ncbi:hypothetical protein WMF31_37575 [Sorangium sp. So ce1036]|uniref:hypothetical protein n=1 Tax=Sorangium sp. So ce1036 TaxID=3133328 RepID=UPI003F07CC40
MPAAFFAEVQPTALRALNYAPEVERFKAARARHRCVPLGSLVRDMGTAYRRIFQRVECDPDAGVELLGQSDMFSAEPVGRWIRPDGIRGIDDQLIMPWQVLFAGVGTLGENELFGRCILADGRLKGRIIGSDAVALNFAEPGSALACFAYAFLCSRTGIRAVRATGYGTKLMSLRLDFLRNLPIPLGTDEQIERVGHLIRMTVGQRETYARHLSEARALLSKIDGFTEAQAMCEHREARCVRWDGPLTTFTAWTYASAGEALSYLAGRWSGRLSDVIEDDGIFNGNRFARTSCDHPHGIDLLSQRDVFLIRPSPRRVTRPSFSDRVLLARPFTLLVGGAGTLGEGELFGRVEMPGEDWAGLGISQHLLRIFPRREHAALAFAFLSSIVGFRLLRSTAVGTKILSLRPDLLRALPFPDVTTKLTASLENSVKAALEARASAASAEREAVRVIEEEVLPAWLV